MSTPEPQPDQAKHALLARAITDIQGSIHANDSKSAAGLVVQGLLATAVVAVVSQLGPVYGRGTAAAQAAIAVSLAGALLLAVPSILFFVAAVRPYEPRKLAEGLRNRDRDYKGVFFPNIKAVTKALTRGSHDEFNTVVSTFESDVQDLSEPGALDREYVAELLKVADIRVHEAKQAKAGFLLLGLEVFFVAAYLAIVGCIAVNVSGLASPSAKPSLDWLVVQGGQRLTIASGSSLTLKSPAKAQVRLSASDDSSLRSVHLVQRAAIRCVRRGARRVLRSPPVTQNVRLSHRASFTFATRFDYRNRRCPHKLRAAGFTERFSAEAQDDSGMQSSGWLIIHAHP